MVEGGGWVWRGGVHAYISILISISFVLFFFFQAEDGIRDHCVTGVQTCALPICVHISFIFFRLKHLNLEKNEISAVPQLEPKTIKHDKLSEKQGDAGEPLQGTHPEKIPDQAELENNINETAEKGREWEQQQLTGESKMNGNFMKCYRLNKHQCLAGMKP